MLQKLLVLLAIAYSSNSLPLDEFFPFGSAVGDRIIPSNDDESEGPIRLPVIFPYFDNNHRQIWIANNGLFSFLSAIRDYVPIPFPLSNDQRLVAGFWTDIDTRGVVNGTGNKVYYQLHEFDQPSNSTQVIFARVKNYTGQFFSQQRPFEATMTIIATWFCVGAFSQQKDKLNTFQIVLTTDGYRSFVFFLYHDIQWISPSNASNSFAQAGFNAGDGVTFKTLPYSNTPDIAKLVNSSNVNIPGLFAFQVDTEKIEAGGCHENSTTVSFRPRMGSLFGSTAIRIQGPCFTNESVIKCRFGSSLEAVDGYVVNDFQAVCLTPFASVHSRVPISISVDNGSTYIPAGIFTYVPMQFGTDGVTIETGDDANLIHVGQYIKLKWGFSEMTMNTFPNDTKIDIQLWKVRLNNQSQLEKDDSFILLRENLDFNNSIHIQLPPSIAYMSTCFIRVVARFHTRIYAGLNTGILVVKSAPRFAQEHCQNWMIMQPDPSTWNNDTLLPCPMRREQAIAAARCCYKSDPQCQKNSVDPSNCWLHQARHGHNESSAVECYTSITSNKYHAGTECCYDSDGLIITYGRGAGTDDRYHAETSVVQHFFHDTLPYLQCCVMNINSAYCDSYMYYRPPRRGSETRDGISMQWGDPHFETFDGFSYTFNGHGEYTYLAISKERSSLPSFNATNQSYIFVSQIRTVPLLSNGATITKAFAARSNEPEAKSISITASRREQIVLRRDNETLEFEDNINAFHFPELTIIRTNQNNSSHYFLRWHLGISIEIKVTKLLSPNEQLVLNVGASVSGIYRERTYGLLGTYDGNSDNDLRCNNGTILNRNASLEEIHRNFGVTWTIDPKESLFYYEQDQSAQFFQNTNQHFIPSFIDPTTVDNSTIRNICRINSTSSPSSWDIAQKTCFYDLFMTQDVNFAQQSLSIAEELLLIRENQRNPPLFNTTLPLKMNLKKGESVYLNMSASSEYSAHIIELRTLHRPLNSKFDEQTGIFQWKAVEGEHRVSIEAHDKTFNLKSRHDLIFNVSSANNTHSINSGNDIQSTPSKIVFLASILGLIIAFSI